MHPCVEAFFAASHYAQRAASREERFLCGEQQLFLSKPKDRRNGTVERAMARMAGVNRQSTEWSIED
jgi:hypothetical protein